MRRAVPLSIAIALLVSGVAHGRARRSISIRVSPVTVAPGGNVEACYVARIPATSAFALGSWHVRHRGAVRGASVLHFLVYLYRGERLGEFAAGQVALSRGCLDLGPIDRDARVLVGTGGSNRHLVRAFPPGVAMPLDPVPDAPGGTPQAIGILLDTNWTNDGKVTHTMSSRLVLRAASPKRIRRTARVLADRDADAGIVVPPFAAGVTEDHVDARWTATGDTCVLGLSGQMHRRGRCIGVDLLGTDGQPKTVAQSPENPCASPRRQLFVGVDFSDPGAFSFTTPLVVRAGEALRYGCWIDNGARAVPVRLGCETSPGTTPGAVGSPAPECEIVGPASPDCDGGAACVPANAVAGPGVDDEVCGMTALVYDAAPGGGCDVSEAP